MEYIMRKQSILVSSILLQIYFVCGSSFLLPTVKHHHHHHGHAIRSSLYHSIPSSTPVQSNTRLSSAVSSSGSNTVLQPRLTADHLQQLRDQQYVVIDDFLSRDMVQQLQADVQALRSQSQNHFAVAKIGQDSTNTLNTEIRVAETCFLGPTKLSSVPNDTRQNLYEILDAVRVSLQDGLACPLDARLTELLYAYYPQGGYYRRHRDAVPQSASTLRQYSLLLYLNDADWTSSVDGGALRLHFDSGGDELPVGQEPNYRDVKPSGGTLVLFQSDAIPHEVLDTQRERVAVVGWYNRPVQVSDAVELGAVSPMRLAMLAVAAGLVTVGLVNIL